ncbi:HDOD domain-containing protein [uncultured Massilia sp.]|uniref:HDOD domain-containing protein n=1 Tax=uncultured Massilia sp. TaxID=169973 RepID=UPI0025F34519|nr:HDOD domain-containing protein [uncultured Massilia sp.]
MNRLEAFGTIVAQAERGEISFPTSVNAVLRLQQALNDPDCHLEEAIRLVLGEPQLAARTVALANTAIFNGGGRPVTNVRTAVERIGYRNLQMLATGLAVRQFGARIADPDLRAKAAQLWEHTVQVAALAHVFARCLTFVNPDTAMFAGIVHEVGAFYLLSRADGFPGLLDDDPEKWAELCEDVVTREVARKLMLPEPIAEAIFGLRGRLMAMPPATLLDTLLLANTHAAVPSPLGPPPAPLPAHADSVLDYLVDEDDFQAMIDDALDVAASMEQALLV